MTDSKLPEGWSANMIEDVASHYDEQTEEEAVAEDEAAIRNSKVAYMAVPGNLVDEVRDFLFRKTGTEG